MQKPKKERRKSASSIDTNELTDMDRKEDYESKHFQINDGTSDRHGAYQEYDANNY